ncbi:26S proteasome non-ATPase regulatory subunit 6-like [Mercenaria mercenaria]|uniref:26S proteasome non-ATPase regulatory subunit 6-like n=1 Tax=Mercenaria mercenaria TaxID=6596 RepID=UPI00234E711D|nr:26S proteasome non-ATPase regulatory subunit 6-like [Mercenaria mercenaria]
MPIENLEEEGLAKNPNLELAQWKFLLTTDIYKDDKEIKKKTMDFIIENNMAPFYEELCHSLSWKIDQALLKKMRAVNEAELKKLDEAIADAEKNLGESEIRENMLKKAEYLCAIGDKEECLSQFRKTQEKTVSLGYRLDLVFHLIRIGLFYMDHDLINRNLEKAQSLIDEGGDWDRRNRLKVYRGVTVCYTNFKEAPICSGPRATFTSYDIEFFHCAISKLLLLSCRLFCSLLQVVKGSEILEVLHSLPKIRKYLFSLYDTHYGDFFRSLAEVEELMKFDRYLNPHYRYYVREMRIVAYNQLLESYRSLTLEYMADAFGVTIQFIDQELSRFIAAGRLHAKIDKVGGIVETNRPDSKNWQYQETIKKGDILLNRVQKLSRVINI